MKDVNDQLKDLSEIYPAAQDLTSLIEESVCKKRDLEGIDARFNLAISGGGSPAALFKLWREKYFDALFWESVELYWVDERCVPPDDKESNYGETKRALLDFISLKESSIHRIKGESDPETEASRYSSLVRKNLKQVNGYPGFDLIIAGIGTDGHTSSIFPGQNHLLSHPEPYTISRNPYNGQKRITMTAGVMINAQQLVFYLFGEEKRDIVETLYSSSVIHEERPVRYIVRQTPLHKLYWDR
ncbi:MAG: 6-phosphogluconolactonase [Bacteroidales bacterium]|nr:6-phosphogluconolactonase [Bacteroidales bacterium]MDD2425499.1 6-phosphogluconolactonase [Bacteroidales bacterium]MDD3989777.1 6-phosphogluconolactonase [Bacteroidales bacterium]MDD4639185.1 6-phosphogluconolactonase [Bacteroidales bacterium]